MIKRHGITLDEYNAKLETQGGVCANPMCTRTATENGKRLVVDHDHGHCEGRESCGQCIRGILCDRCNMILGHVKDDQSLLLGGPRSVYRRMDACGVR